MRRPVPRAGGSRQLRSLKGRKLTSELLAVQDTALLVLAGDSVWVAPFRSIQLALVQQRESLSFGERQTPGRRQRDELSRLARFPGGIPAGVMAELLREHAQTRPGVVD